MQKETKHLLKEYNNISSVNSFDTFFQLRLSIFFFAASSLFDI